MYFLSFETSTKKNFSLALSQDEKVLRYRNVASASVLEDAILPAVDQILDLGGIKFNQVDAFAVALGPGSFTSLRVGLSTVKAFAMGTNKPIVGIPSMDIVAHGVDKQAYDQVCVISDARRGMVYAALYGPQGREGDYLLTSLENVLDKVHSRTLFVGDALGIYTKNIEEAYQKYAEDKNSACKCFFADEKYWYPQAKVMAVLAYERFRQKKHDDAATLLPLYLYSEDCQVTSPK